MASRPLNYTTTIPSGTTALECQAMLGDGGAQAVALTYADRRPVGLSFVIVTAYGPRRFELPVNVEGIHKVLRAADFSSLHASSARLQGYRTREHAERVAWRVVKDWLEAQLALIDAEMASIEQVMLPYLQVAQGVSMFDSHLENEQRALTAGTGG